MTKLKKLKTLVVFSAPVLLVCQTAQKLDERQCGDSSCMADLLVNNCM